MNKEAARSSGEVRSDEILTVGRVSRTASEASRDAEPNSHRGDRSV